MDSKTFFENFETIANAPSGIARLRELILDLAVHGKLSRKHSADKPISTLVSDLQNDLVPYGEMSEIRFDIPNHWTWLPLASVVNHQLGKMLNISKMKGVERPYLRSVNVRQDGNIDLTDVKRMLIPESELVKYDVRIGDIFVNEGGDVGRNAIWLIQSDQEFAFQNQLHRLRPVCGVESRYVQFVLRHAKSSGVIAAMSSGVTIQHFSASAIRKLAFPLPPVEEQKRIVAKVDELMALCDELETAQNQRNSIRTSARKSAIDAISTATTPEELDVAWKRISGNWLTIADTPESIAALRSLILDLAVRGSLVEQGVIGLSASEVTKSMRQKRQADIQLMKRSERKKDAAQSSQPQLAPSHWKKGLLGEVCLIVMGNSPPGDSYSEVERGVPLINGPVEFSRSPLGMTLRTKFTSKPTYMCKKGDILVCVRGATTGRTNIAGFDACIGRGVALVRGYESQKFINLFMWNIGTVLLAAGKGTTFPSISYDDLANLEIAIPPLDEQERLVAKVESLMDMCDELERSLHIRDELTKKIASAMTAEVAA